MKRQSREVLVSTDTPEAVAEASGKQGDRTSPWMSGIHDGLAGARLLLRSSIPHRIRLAVILLDSTLETAYRSFLVRERSVKLTEAHRDRATLTKVVRKHLSDIDDPVWRSLDYYHEEIRNDFYHESAGKTLTDESYLDYQDTVEFVIDRAFPGSQVGQVADSIVRQSEADARARDAGDGGSEEKGRLLMNVTAKLDRVLIAVAATSPQGAPEVNEFFRREGVQVRLSADEFGGIVRRNKGSNKYFYFDRTAKKWLLSGLGRFRLGQLAIKETQNG
jgi:hypothetical protein